jgi:CRP/FNR family cyclic AMP-dependent transcriptional regulator
MDNVSADRTTWLKAVPLFKGLSDHELKAVVRVAKEIDHEDGHEIIAEGQLGIGFHLILSGEAKVSQGGHELSVLKPGQYFGEIALLDGQGRSATVTAVGPVRTLTIVVWGLEPLLNEHPTMAIALLKELCARLRRAEASIVH